MKVASCFLATVAGMMAIGGVYIGVWLLLVAVLPESLGDGVDWIAAILTMSVLGLLTSGIALYREVRGNHQLSRPLGRVRIGVAQRRKQ